MGQPALSVAPPRYSYGAWRVLAVIALWVILESGFIFVGISPILKGDLADSDAYLQLVRVSHLLETGDWYDSILPRSNWPYGEVTTWTRSLDIVLLGGAFLLRPFMNFHDALFWFGVALSPLCALACAFAVGWMTRPLVGLEARLAVMLLLLLQPGFLSYTYARGPNHHGIMFLVFIFACDFVLRALTQPKNQRAAIGAGIMTGVGLWISMEFLLPLAITLLAFGLLWLFDGDHWNRINRSFSTGLALAVAVLLPVEYPLTGLFVDAYDRLSIVHLLLALLLLAFWIVVPVAIRYGKSTLVSRLVTSAVGAALFAAAMYVVYPKFFVGPFADADPTLLRLLISGNADWQPAAPTSLAGLGRFLFYLGPSLLCLPWMLWTLWTRRREGSAPGWLFLTLMLLAYVAMTVRSHRFSAFAEIVSLIPLIEFIGWARERLSRRAAWWEPLARAAAVTGIIVGLPSAGAFILAMSFAKAPAAEGGTCRLADIAPVLSDPAGLGSRPQVIVAEIHSGPEIMYRTPHSVLATPMIRNPGVLAAYGIMTAADDATAKTIIDARSVSLILLCPQSGERHDFRSDKKEDTLYNRLIDGRLPTWIQVLPLPEELARHFRLFAVRHDAT
jgi:hypothetical protein